MKKILFLVSFSIILLLILIVSIKFTFTGSSSSQGSGQDDSLIVASDGPHVIPRESIKYYRVTGMFLIECDNKIFHIKALALDRQGQIQDISTFLNASYWLAVLTLLIWNILPAFQHKISKWIFLLLKCFIGGILGAFITVPGVLISSSLGWKASLTNWLFPLVGWMLCIWIITSLIFKEPTEGEH